MKYKYSFIALVIFTLAVSKQTYNAEKWKKNDVFKYDTWGYQNYLPAAFIYHDLANFKYIDSVEKIYKPSGDIQRYGLYQVAQTGRYCNQYPCGVALFQLPAFLIAHAFCLRTHMYEADGYSSPYQHAAMLSTIIFVILGLVFLLLFLNKYFSDKEVAIGILIICFGTNLYNYTTAETGLSHPYTFFLSGVVLYLSDKWYTEAKAKYAIIIGICLGLSAVTRPLDFLIFLVPLCWQKKYYPLGITKWQYILKHKMHILYIILFCFLATLPQLLYWHYVSGHWIYFSYSKVDYFEFDRLRIVEGLFSYRKGWFLYTPLALLGFIGAFNWNKDKTLSFYFPSFWIFILPTIYLVFSWHCWFYGWSYSCRALIHVYPILAFPICNLLTYWFKKYNQYVVSAIIFLFIGFNLFQTWQYQHGILRGDLMNKAYYWQVFGKTKIGKREFDILEKSKQYDNEHGW